MDIHVSSPGTIKPVPTLRYGMQMAPLRRPFHLAETDDSDGAPSLLQTALSLVRAHPSRQAPGHPTCASTAACASKLAKQPDDTNDTLTLPDSDWAREIRVSMRMDQR